MSACDPSAVAQLRHTEDVGEPATDHAMNEAGPRDPGVRLLVAILDQTQVGSLGSNDESGSLCRRLLWESEARFSETVSRLCAAHLVLVARCVRAYAAAPCNQDDGMLLACLDDLAEDLEQRVVTPASTASSVEAE
jgi:hypothetical protein